MAAGIYSTISVAVGAATALASAVSTAASNQLRIASPSKVFIEKGLNVGRGFVIGMDRTQARVAAAARELANAAMVGEGGLAANAALRSVTPAVVPVVPGSSSATHNLYNTNVTIDPTKIQTVEQLIGFVAGLTRSADIVSTTGRRNK